MRKRTVPITIDVPVEVLKFIDDHSFEFTALVSAIVLQARNRTQQLELEENTSAQSYGRLANFVDLGRSEYRKYRLVECQGDFGDLKGPALERAVLDRLYDPPNSQTARNVLAIRHFRRALRKRILARRNREIVRSVSLGIPDGRIASRYGLAVGSIRRIIGNYRRERRRIGDPKLGGFIKPGGQS